MVERGESMESKRMDPSMEPAARTFCEFRSEKGVLTKSAVLSLQRTSPFEEKARMRPEESPA